MDCLLSLDLGTTTCRCVALDLQGHLLAQAFRETGLWCPHAGHAEADPAEWWGAAGEVIRQVVDELSSRGLRPLVMGLTGLMHAMVPLDNEGHTLGRAMLWMDQRSQPQVDWLNSQHQESIASVFGPAARVTTTPSLSKLRWLAENEPELVRQAQCFLLSKDYVRYRLTGALATDPSDAGGTMLYDRKTGAWSPTMVQLAGIGMDQLPPIVPSTHIGGHISAEAARFTHLPEGLPVCVGAGDVESTVLGMGGEVADRALIYLGTAAWVWLLRSDGTRVMRATATTGAALRWLRDLVGGSYDSLVCAADAIPAGADGLLFLPHLCGERAPYFRADARGSLLGLSLSHSRGHLARAVLEGCACHLRWLLEGPAGAVPPRGVVAGGGAHSVTWVQILADVLGAPLYVPEVVEAGAMGAALLAAVAASLYPETGEATRHMVRLGEAIPPLQDRLAAYRQVYQRFRKAETAIGPGTI